MTELLYYADSHLNDFDAVVLSCEQSNNQYRITLDKTAFFPEGGGQSADTGIIGCAEVTDVQTEGCDIAHYTTAPLTIGSTVHCSINWEQRFSRMQDHSGEHIISGLVSRHFGYENIGFHMGADFMTVDFTGKLTKDQLEFIELEANRIVRENRPITTKFPTPDELDNISYRSKLDIRESVRLVNIEGVDICACCAPHVSYTGEIGLIHIISSVPYKGGTRIQLLCGDDAVSTVFSRCKSAAEISALLSVKQDDIAFGVQRVLNDIAVLKERCSMLESMLTDNLLNTAEIADGKLCVFVENLSAAAIKNLADKGADAADVCAIFAKADDGYTYTVCSKKRSLTVFAKELNSALNGKGGGKPNMIQGRIASDRTSIESFWKSQNFVQ